MCWTYQIRYTRCGHVRATTEFCGKSHVSRRSGLRKACGTTKVYTDERATLRADGVCGYTGTGPDYADGCPLSSLYDRSFDHSARCDRCGRLCWTMRVYYDPDGWCYHCVCRDCTYSYER
jgi:hypothetical protein